MDPIKTLFINRVEYTPDGVNVWLSDGSRLGGLIQVATSRYMGQPGKIDLEAWIKLPFVGKP